MLLICRRNAFSIFHRFDVAYWDNMELYTSLLYHHVHNRRYQQALRKHTQAKSVVDLGANTKTTTATTKQENRSKSNNMQTSTATSSSAFSSYSREEESITKMQLKHLQQHKTQQQQQQQQYPTHQTDNSIPATTSTTITTTTTTATTSKTSKANGDSVNIPYNIDWIFERLKYPNRLHLFLGHIIVAVVGLFSKIVLVFMNKTKVYNRERLIEAVLKRPPGVPLVTVSNHQSCFDDPGLWGILPMRALLNFFHMRWSLAAHDICFTNKYHATFFMLGKCIPVIRGCGVYQAAIDVCVQKVKMGQWVHVFPEGKVNMTKEEMRLKWGVGRIICESSKVPIIIPMWHEGMDDVLPNVEPYVLKWGNKVTLNIGKPIDLNDFINDLKSKGVEDLEARKLISDKIQDVFHVLRLETHELHKKHKQNIA